MVEHDAILCPRCKRSLRAGPGGPFRGMANTSLRCTACGLGLLRGPEARALTGGHDLLSSAALRERKDAGQDCPFCTYRRLSRLTLAWGEDWVSVEQCEGCSAMALEEGEREGLSAILSAAQPLSVVSIHIPAQEPPPPATAVHLLTLSTFCLLWPLMGVAALDGGPTIEGAAWVLFTLSASALSVASLKRLRSVHPGGGGGLVFGLVGLALASVHYFG